MSHRWLSRGLLVAACAAAVWSYWPGLVGGFYFDDLPNIVEVPALHWQGPTWEELRNGLSEARMARRWVANATFGLNHLWGGLDPRGYRVVNLVVHLLVGLALAWVAWLYGGGSERAGKGVGPASAVAALLFLVHPLNVQGVTYVVQRMTSLAALFSLLSFGCYLAARRSASRLRAGLLAACGLASWLLALGSKENAAALPLVVIAYELAFHRRELRRRVGEAITNRRIWSVALGLMIPLAAGAVLWKLYLEGVGIQWLEPYADREFSGLERLLTQGRVQLLYLSLLVWPAPGRLNLDHEFAVSRSMLEPATLAALVFWLVASAAVLWLCRRRPRYGFPLLAYLLLHVIESGPLNLELVFEHRMYLPLAFLALLLPAVPAKLGPRRSRLAVALALVAAVPLAVATHSRNVTWADPISLHLDCARKSPGKFRAQFNLGTYLGVSGRYFEAIPYLRRALEIRPDSSEAHNQLGATYLEINLPDRALAELREAVRLGPENAEAHYNLASLLEARGQIEDAVALYRRFLEIAPPGYEAVRSAVERKLRSLRPSPRP